jgi:hypothetical protein
VNRAEALRALGATLLSGGARPRSQGVSLAAGPLCQLNVRDFGAKGDGKTDDTDAVQKAITAAASVAKPWNGGRLCVPAGVYIVGPLIVNAHCLILVGEGWTNTVLQLRPQSNGDLLTVNGGPNVNFTSLQIESLQLDGNRAEQSGTSHCLHVSSVWNCVFGPGLALRNARTDGLFFSTDGGKPGCVQNWSHGLFVENCGRYGIHATEDFQQFNVADSIIQWNTAGGICYEPNPGKMGGHISHNYFEGIPGGREQAYGIIVNANQYQSMEIHNNVFNQMRTAAVWLRSGTRAVSLKANQSGSTGGPFAVIVEPGSYGHVAEINDWDKPVSGMLPNTVAAGMSEDRGNADVTLVVGRDHPTQRFATRLTATHTVTLSGDFALNGARFRIVRTAPGNYPLRVLDASMNQDQWLDLEYDGQHWYVVAAGKL